MNMDVTIVARCALQIIRHLALSLTVTRWCQLVATVKACCGYCSSLVTKMSNVSLSFLSNGGRLVLIINELCLPFLVTSVCYNCNATIYAQAYCHHHFRIPACGRDSDMNPQHIRGHNVNTAISPQYAKGSQPYGTRPGVTLSWTTAQGHTPKNPL